MKKRITGLEGGEGEGEEKERKRGKEGKRKTKRQVFQSRKLASIVLNFSLKKLFLLQRLRIVQKLISISHDKRNSCPHSSKATD